MTLETIKFKYPMLVADIGEEFINGMCIMNSRGLQLDFKHGSPTVDNEELVIHKCKLLLSNHEERNPAGALYTRLLYYSTYFSNINSPWVLERPERTSNKKSSWKKEDNVKRRWFSIKSILKRHGQSARRLFLTKM